MNQITWSIIKLVNGLIFYRLTQVKVRLEICDILLSTVGREAVSVEIVGLKRRTKTTD
jgi:hypothetical protein